MEPPEPKGFTAEVAKIAKTYQSLSERRDIWAEIFRTGPPGFSASVVCMRGIPLRPLRTLRFNGTVRAEWCGVERCRVFGNRAKGSVCVVRVAASLLMARGVTYEERMRAAT